MCQCLRVLCIDHFPNCGGSDCLGSAEPDMVPQFTRKNAMLTERFCDRDRQRAPSPPHANAETSPPHANAETELRERRAVEVRQQLQGPHPQPTRHEDDILNLATERYQAVIEADEKGELAWEEAKKAEALRKTDAAAAKKHALAALHSAQEHQRMQQDKDAQAASAGAAAHLSPHP